MSGWTLRQDPAALTLCSQDLLTEPRNLAYAVLDMDDEWQIFSETEGHMASVCLEDVVRLLPPIAALGFLPTGMVVDWEEDIRTWSLGTLGFNGFDPEELTRWTAQAGLRNADPAEICYITPDLAQFPESGDGIKGKFIFQVSRYDDGILRFFGWDDTEEGDVLHEARLRDVAILYPDMVPVIERNLRAGEELVWDNDVQEWAAP